MGKDGTTVVSNLLRPIEDDKRKKRRRENAVEHIMVELTRSSR